MKRLRYAILMLIFLSITTSGQTAGIHPDLNNALQAANKSGKLLLVDFYGGWCPWCVKMDETFANTEIKTLMQDKFYYYKLDIGRFDQHKECIQQYGVEGIPYIIVFNPDGSIKTTCGGYANVEKFKNFLEAAQTVVEAPAPTAQIEKPVAEPKKTDVLLTKGYGLLPNEDLKYINPSVREEKKSASAFFRWSDGEGLSEWIGTDTVDVRNMLRILANVFPQEIEGDQKLLSTEVPGDFVVRAGTSPDKIAGRLEEVLRRDLKLPVRFSFRDVERKVIVAQGIFHLNPMSERRPNRIEIYSENLNQDPNSGVPGNGDFQLFLKGVGMYLDRRVVSYVKVPNEGSLEWRYSDENGGSKDIGLALQHLAEQTGLTFKEENRLVRVLFVERGD